MEGRKRQSQIFIDGMSGKRPKLPLSPQNLETAARRRMSAKAFAYIAGGAGTEATAQANRAAFDRVRILPHMLRDVSRRDTRLTLFGDTLPSPILLAPIGVLEMCHRRADRAVAEAAASEGIPFIFSSQASVSMEQCAGLMGNSPRWFQLYWSTSNELVESFLDRAQRAGCSAIVLTLDTTMLGWRPRDLELGYLPFLRGKGIAQYTSDPVFLQLIEKEMESELSSTRRSLTPQLIASALQMGRSFPEPTLKALLSGRARRAVQRFIATYSRPSLQWEDLAWLRKRTSLPIVLKGILAREDARRALDYGADGIIVSNHGGRQVDGAVSSMDALPRIVEVVDGAVPVLLDSGIRSGADVFKARARGATAVCVGRPYAYALALRGAAGVREYLSNLSAELDLTMGLSGCRSLTEIDEATIA